MEQWFLPKENERCFSRSKRRKRSWSWFRDFGLWEKKSLHWTKPSAGVERGYRLPRRSPGFPRTVVDGYAIRAKDSFGATESLPALLEIVGEVGMGQVPSMTVAAGQAVKISTGGMVPKGADGVVMVEYCHLMDQTTVEVSRAISPQENVIQPDDDFKKGAVVLRKGWKLRSQDVGVLAGLGVTESDRLQKAKGGHYLHRR